MLAGLERGHRNGNVPVIRGADYNGIHIFSGKQFPEVVDFGAVRAEIVRGFRSMNVIQIADCNYLASVLIANTLRIAHALPLPAFPAAYTNPPNVDLVVTANFLSQLIAPLSHAAH